MKAIIHDVFVPNDTPTATYVERAELKLEDQLKNALQQSKILVSVSGPSKSGKTVLIDKCVPEARRVLVSGATITSADDVWRSALSQMGIPLPSTVQHEKTTGGKKTASGSLGISKANKGGFSHENAQSYRKVQDSQNLTSTFELAVGKLKENQLCLFIDDFHYSAEPAREMLGRQLKAALESGCQIIAASVPYRTDDVVRTNVELRGRVVGIDSTYWRSSELKEIFSKGFHILNVNLPDTLAERLAEEAIGSPQLMQTMCLQLCYALEIKETFDERKRFSPSEETIKGVLAATAQYTDFSKMFKALSAGPRVRGQERKVHSLINGKKGDVYSAILLALATDPAELSMPYDEIQRRVRDICDGESPAGSSVTGALEQMSIIAEAQQGEATPLIWDGDNLELTDPYFLFYLRCSDRL